ncbi:phasin family protein [Paraburkholderia sp. UYCP14C]|nr:phasin family protein [Paraburkholderia sp. UYCP14C]
MPFVLPVSPDVSPLPDQLLAGFSALIRLNMDTCRSAVTGAALRWESVLLAQTPEQFIRRQADVMPWLAQQFAGYARGCLDIALEATRPRDAASHHDDGHEHQEDAMSAGVPARAAGVDAMTAEAAPLEVQPEGESVAEAHAGEMARAILERVAKPTPGTTERRNPPRARRSSTR